MYYVYVIKNEEGKLYTGFSSDLKRRLKEHNAKSSNYTKKSDNWKLVYYEAYLSKRDALIREKRSKDGRARYLLRQRIANSLK